MKEIKFRAWGRPLSRMVYPRSLPLPNTDGADDPGRMYVYMQFTGLLDKNGQEIYEGDVVRGQWDDCGTFGNMSCRVEWDAEFGMWIFIDIDPAYSEQNHLTWPYFVDDTAEVIGNIYEGNPTTDTPP